MIGYLILYRDEHGRISTNWNNTIYETEGEATAQACAARTAHYNGTLRMWVVVALSEVGRYG